MKSLEWTGPEKEPMNFPISKAEYWDAVLHPESQPSISEMMDRLHHEKHAKFRRWQDAMQMNMIFGDNYVTVPEIPAGYEAYAKWWYDNELKDFK